METVEVHVVHRERQRDVAGATLALREAPVELVALGGEASLLLGAERQGLRVALFLLPQRIDFHGESGQLLSEVLFLGGRGGAGGELVGEPLQLGASSLRELQLAARILQLSANFLELGLQACTVLFEFRDLPIEVLCPAHQLPPLLELRDRPPVALSLPSDARRGRQREGRPRCPHRRGPPGRAPCGAPAGHRISFSPLRGGGGCGGLRHTVGGNLLRDRLQGVLLVHPADEASVVPDAFASRALDGTSQADAVLLAFPPLTVVGPAIGPPMRAFAVLPALCELALVDPPIWPLHGADRSHEVRLPLARVQPAVAPNIRALSVHFAELELSLVETAIAPREMSLAVLVARMKLALESRPIFPSLATASVLEIVLPLAAVGRATSVRQRSVAALLVVLELATKAHAIRKHQGSLPMLLRTLASHGIFSFWHAQPRSLVEDTSRNEHLSAAHPAAARPSGICSAARS
mmetsp:Transcript_166941/g.530899  ORF Transcript_166941/g.530899 Transcript_166941/m.530899 type:complete len:466 (-) Transcript_166941:340-1737(-)